MKMKIIDARHLISLPEQWIVVVPAGTDCSGLVELERDVVAEMGVEAEWTLGDDLGAFYSSRADADRVAKALMMKRPGLVAWAKGDSDQR